MLRGLYTAATGMTAQRKRMNVLTNNIVNAETTGYKKDILVDSSFNQVMLQRINDPNVSVYGAENVGNFDYGVRIDELFTDFTQGPLEQTGIPTDLAIEGSGFFAVETPEGERYTRSGNFAVNANGYLVTEDGNYVLGESGRINVGGTDFKVLPDGSVTTASGAVDKLRLVTFGDLNSLRKQGNNLYYIFGGAGPVKADSVSVKQGYQESANINLADEMVNMLAVYRNYEASQKIVGMTDDSLGLAANLGKLGN